MEEIWKPIEDYIGLYEVSNLGRVRSLTRYENVNGGIRKKQGIVLKCNPHSNGYLFVALRPILSKKTHLVHILVANAFLEKTSSNLVVNHIDSDRSNNNVSNLEWVTHSENMYHARTNGNANFCYICRKVRLTNNITNDEFEFDNLKSACDMLGRTKGFIGRKAKQLGKNFTYKEWTINVDI